MSSPTSLRIPDDLKSRYTELAKLTKRTPHWLMIEALKDYAIRQEKRMAFIREAIASEKEYKETGLHITLDECLTWIDSLGTENEKDVPKCHR